MHTSSYRVWHQDTEVHQPLLFVNKASFKTSRQQRPRDGWGSRNSFAIALDGATSSVVGDYPRTSQRAWHPVLNWRSRPLLLIKV